MSEKFGVSEATYHKLVANHGAEHVKMYYYVKKYRYGMDAFYPPSKRTLQVRENVKARQAIEANQAEREAEARRERAHATAAMFDGQ